ncbi:lactate racemase domain-containing protein [Bythopirellula goksoeyrii]|nr:lactate racemase domain-containing protein [Bythopirellula goksoeyrii]
MPTLLDTINLTETSPSTVTTLGARSVVPIDNRQLPDHVQRAFDDPLDYPPLASATVPGDRVAIALQAGVPQLNQILSGTLSALAHAGVEEEYVTVVVPPGQEQLQSELQDELGSRVSIVVHSSDDIEQLAMLGVTEAGEPLRLNRILCDADLVISIRPAQGKSSHPMPMEPIFPTFADQESINRFQTPRHCETPSQRARLAQESDRCNALLGLSLSMDVVPGPEGSVAACMCGTPRAVAKRSAQQYRDIWGYTPSESADLVVASLGSDPSQQTWHALSRALSVAEELVSANGAIAICSAIATPPGPALKRLKDTADLSDLENKLKNAHHADSILARQLCRILQQHTVYLASSLKPTTVECLGMAPITNEEELGRLIASQNNCLLLDHAHFLQPKVSEDA